MKRYVLTVERDALRRTDTFEANAWTPHVTLDAVTSEPAQHQTLLEPKTFTANDRTLIRLDFDRDEFSVFEAQEIRPASLRDCPTV